MYTLYFYRRFKLILHCVACFTRVTDIVFCANICWVQMLFSCWMKRVKPKTDFVFLLTINVYSGGSVSNNNK